MVKVFAMCANRRRPTLDAQMKLFIASMPPGLPEDERKFRWAYESPLAGRATGNLQAHGGRVQLRGIEGTHSKLNGQKGTITSWVAEIKQFSVDIDGGDKVAAPIENLLPLDSNDRQLDMCTTSSTECTSCTTPPANLTSVRPSRAVPTCVPPSSLYTACVWPASATAQCLPCSSVRL